MTTTTRPILFRHQLSALFHKNLSLHRRHLSTTLCQILIPILLICIIGLFQYVMDTQIRNAVDKAELWTFANYDVGQVVPRRGFSKVEALAFPLVQYLTLDGARMRQLEEWVGDVPKQKTRVPPFNQNPLGWPLFLPPPFLDDDGDTTHQHNNSIGNPVDRVDEELTQISTFWQRELNDYLGIGPQLSKERIEEFRDRIASWLRAGNLSMIPPMQVWIFNKFQPAPLAGDDDDDDELKLGSEQRDGSELDVTIMPGGRYNGWQFMDYVAATTSPVQGLYPEIDRRAVAINLLHNTLFRQWDRHARRHANNTARNPPHQIMQLQPPVNLSRYHEDVFDVTNSSTDQAYPSINTRYEGMPQKLFQTLDLSTILGVYLIGFAVSFLLPPFISAIVTDKQDKILLLMRMSGLRIYVYWIVTYLYYLANFVVVTGSMYVVAVLFRMRIFTQTDPLLLILALILWGNALIALSFLFSTFFNSARTASMLSYFIVILGVTVSNLLNSSVYMNSPPPLWFLLYPPFAFYRLLFILADACINDQCATLSWLTRLSSTSNDASRVASVQPRPPLMLMLFLESVVLFILAWYVYEISPKEYGVRRKWYFVFEHWVDWLQSAWVTRGWGYERLNARDFDHDRDGDGEESGGSPELDDLLEVENGCVAVDPSAATLMDEDVRHEKEMILHHGTMMDADYALVIRGLRKEFPAQSIGSGFGRKRGKKVAVRDMYLALAPGEVFGLLGANGAGKTTLISCLTGLIAPSFGTASYFSGELDIYRDMDQVQSRIGVCLQFDVFYPKLTCLDHILFYARLKGYSGKLAHQHAMDILDQVGLKQQANKMACELSGGMRRRLSIGIAITGQIDLLIMDEPSTGLDPLTRRQLWEVFRSILERRKKEQGRPLTVILTTHAMDEADLLCDRIGIMDEGRLKCLGSAEYLKMKYSQGYTLTLNVKPMPMLTELDVLGCGTLLEMLKGILVGGGMTKTEDLRMTNSLHSYGLVSKSIRVRLLPEQSIGQSIKFQIEVGRSDADGGDGDSDEGDQKLDMAWSQYFEQLNRAKVSQVPLLIPRWLSGYSSKATIEEQGGTSALAGSTKEDVSVTVVDWGISMTTLEDVFIGVVKK